MAKEINMFDRDIALVGARAPMNSPGLRERGVWRVGALKTGLDVYFVCEPNYEKFMKLVKSLDPKFDIGFADGVSGFTNAKITDTLPGIIKTANAAGGLVSVHIIWTTMTFDGAKAYEKEDHEILQTLRHEIGHVSDICSRYLSIPKEEGRREIPAYVSELLNSFVDCKLLEITPVVESGLHMLFTDPKTDTIDTSRTVEFVNVKR